MYAARPVGKYVVTEILLRFSIINVLIMFTLKFAQFCSLFELFFFLFSCETLFRPIKVE